MTAKNDTAAEHVCTSDCLTAREDAYGWSVESDCGGRWWPDAATAAEIEASDDPAATALRICDEETMRGEWRS